MKRTSLFTIVAAFAISLMAFSVIDQEKWVVPAKYQKMQNPTDADDDEGLEIGEELFMKHCKSCHGSEGLGDGPKAKDQKGDLGDFSSKAFQSQTDGALFYKSKFGRDDMPNFEKKITDDEDMWYIVNFMRTLAE